MERAASAAVAVATKGKGLAEDAGVVAAVRVEVKEVDAAAAAARVATWEPLETNRDTTCQPNHHPIGLRSVVNCKLPRIAIPTQHVGARVNTPSLLRCVAMVRYQIVMASAGW